MIISLDDDEPQGLTSEEGANLLSATGLGVRLSMVNFVAAAATVYEQTAEAQGMWMQLTGWNEKSLLEKIIYCLEAPFTILRWLTIPPVLYDTDEDGTAPDKELTATAAGALNDIPAEELPLSSAEDTPALSAAPPPHANRPWPGLPPG